jgi:hypothetical protein
MLYFPVGIFFYAKLFFTSPPLVRATLISAAADHKRHTVGEVQQKPSGKIYGAGV